MLKMFPFSILVYFLTNFFILYIRVGSGDECFGIVDDLISFKYRVMALDQC